MPRKPVLITLFLPTLFVTAVNGQTSVRDHHRFALYNECRPMELVVDFGLSRIEESPFTSLVAQIKKDSQKLLEEQGLLTGDPIDSNRAYLKIRGSFRDEGDEGYSFKIYLEFNKLVIDSASGMENVVVTWGGIRASGGGSGLDNENFIGWKASRIVGGFLDRYIRVNEKACGDAVIQRLKGLGDQIEPESPGRDPSGF